MEQKIKNCEQAEVDHLLASTGFIFPRTEGELDKFTEHYSKSELELEGYFVDSGKLVKSCQLRNELPPILKVNVNRSTYFKRIVLAAEIASQLHDKPTFGHVKLQKMMFLCENIQSININCDYSKQAAGPYDSQFMHSIDFALEKQKWFTVKKEQSGKSVRYFFIPSENFNGHKQYFERYFLSNHKKIQWFIDTFRKAKTDQVELIATLYACWQELTNTNQLITETQLLSSLYSWSKEKQKYSEQTALKAIKWMKDNNVVPV